MHKEIRDSTWLSDFTPFFEIGHFVTIVIGIIIVKKKPPPHLTSCHKEYGIDTYFTECSPSQSSRDQVDKTFDMD